MRAWLGLALLLLACTPTPKTPPPKEGPFLVIFQPWVSAKEIPAPSATALQITKLEQEVLQGAKVISSEAAMTQAKTSIVCADLPCAADLSRSINATWFITAELLAFPPAHCFVFFSARSFESGAEIFGYNPEEVESSNVSISSANFALKSEKLKRCDDPAFYEQVRKTLRKMTEDPALRRGLGNKSESE